MIPVSGHHGRIVKADVPGSRPVRPSDDLSRAHVPVRQRRPASALSDPAHGAARKPSARAEDHYYGAR